RHTPEEHTRLKNLGRTAREIGRVVAELFATVLFGDRALCEDNARPVDCDNLLPTCAIAQVVVTEGELMGGAACLADRSVEERHLHRRKTARAGRKDHLRGKEVELEGTAVKVHPQPLFDYLRLAREVCAQGRMADLRYDPCLLNLLEGRDLGHV